MHRKWLLVGTVVLLAFAAGCTGGGGGDGGDSGSGDSDWCGTASIEGIAGQQFGGVETAEVRGTTERDGRAVCQISYETERDSNPYARTDVFFDEDRQYVQFVYYDADGNELGQFEYSAPTSGGATTGDTGSVADGSDSQTGGSASWCQVGQTTSVSDSAAASGMTFSVEGLVERDGMTLCRASFEMTGENAAYSRVDMLFSEDESHQEMVYYDAEGNVIQEVTVSDGS